MDFRRIQAQRHAELDDVLLRSVHAEQARLQNKLHLMLSEIEGARKIIAEYQDQIRELEPQAAHLQETLDMLEHQEREIQNDQARWQSQMAG